MAPNWMEGEKEDRDLSNWSGEDTSFLGWGGSIFSLRQGRRMGLFRWKRSGKRFFLLRRLGSSVSKPVSNGKIIAELGEPCEIDPSSDQLE